MLYLRVVFSYLDFIFNMSLEVYQDDFCTLGASDPAYILPWKQAYKSCFRGVFSKATDKGKCL